MASQRYYYEEPAYVIAGGSVLPFFALIVTALRLHFRIKQRQPLKADDWLVFPAMVRAWRVFIIYLPNYLLSLLTWRL